MANADKEQLVQSVNTWPVRSQLSVRRVIERMQARGCPIDRTRFENRFTTRLEQRPNVRPAWTLALVAAFTEGLTAHERAAGEFLAASRRFAPSAASHPPPRSRAPAP